MVAVVVIKLVAGAENIKMELQKLLDTTGFEIRIVFMPYKTVFDNKTWFTIFVRVASCPLTRKLLDGT